MTVAIVSTLIAAALLVYIAWEDLKHLRIRNAMVLLLLGLYAIRSVALSQAELMTDLAAGGLLFGISFVMWLLKAIGAGDVKLMFVLGLLMGFDGLLPFCVMLIAASVLFLVLIKAAQWLKLARGLGGRLAEIGREGKVPYAVVLVTASIPVIAVRALWFT